jgi:hypothetical protein
LEPEQEWEPELGLAPVPVVLEPELGLAPVPVVLEPVLELVLVLVLAQHSHQKSG